MYEHFPQKSIIAFIMGYKYAKVGRHFHNAGVLELASEWGGKTKKWGGKRHEF